MLRKATRNGRARKMRYDTEKRAVRRPLRRDCLKPKRHPNLQDRLVVLLLSLGLFLLVIALGIGMGQMVELVLLLIAVCAVVTINLLVVYSTWDEPGAQEEEPEHDRLHQKE